MNKIDSKNPVISVIIPAYNVDKYISKCLESIVEQTLRNIEIIVINDGSEDNTLNIIEAFAQQDERIKVINQTNQKQGAARNRGLEIASGDCIIFIDADDWIDKNYLEEMYHALTDNHADMAVSQMCRYKNGKDYRACFKFQEYKTYSNVNEIIKVLEIPEQFTASGKLYKKNLIGDLRFEEGVYFEDGRFLIRIIPKISCLITVPNIIYHYVANESSTLRQSHSPERSIDRIKCGLDVLDFCIQSGLSLPEMLIYKETRGILKIKHYQNKKIYFLFGIKLFKQKKEFSIGDIKNVER